MKAEDVEDIPVFGKWNSESRIKIEKIFIKQKRIAKENEFRRTKNIDKLGGINKLDCKLPLCWKCWISITGENLLDYKDSYSDNVLHPTRCPLCFYNGWKGRRWYPKQYLNSAMGNPSSRYKG